MKKLIKKLVVTIACISLLSVSCVSVFAADKTSEEKGGVVSENSITTTSARSASSFTWALSVGQGSIVKQAYFGFNPTVKVTARGNSNMVYKVWVVNPAGIRGDVGYVRADGSSISKNLRLSIGGDYYVYIQPWEGNTNGQTVYVDFNVTW